MIVNQVIPSSIPLGSEFLPSENDCIDHISAHTHNSSFAAPGSDPLTRDGGLSHQSSSLLLPASSLRYMPQQQTQQHRPVSHDSQYSAGPTLTESSTGSIATSPASNDSSLAFAQFQPSGVYSQHQAHPPLALGHSYATQSSIYGQNSAFLPYTGVNYKGRTTHMYGAPTDPSYHSNNYYPPGRPQAMANTTPPSMNSSMRENYTTSTPGVHRHHVSPRTHAQAQADAMSRMSCSSLPETPRSVMNNNHIALSTGMGFSSQPPQADHKGGSPGFGELEVLHEVTNQEGQLVKFDILATVDKGFFLSQDGTHTCYRRNYFSVTMSYFMDPQVPNQRLYLKSPRTGKVTLIKAIAVSLSATVDGSSGKAIELIQHTPKRDKGPQLPISKVRLLPTPPKTNDGQAFGMGYGYNNNQANYAPYLPLQNETDDNLRDSNQVAGTAFSGQTSQYSHTFERIQFKSATANNGKRRAQQQYYHLIADLYVDIREDGASQPEWVKICQRVSAAVVVRGRSPSHYQNEGPHGGHRPGGGAAGGSSHHGSIPMHLSRGIGNNASIAASMMVGGGAFQGSYRGGGTYTFELAGSAQHGCYTSPTGGGSSSDGSLHHQQIASAMEDVKYGDGKGYSYHPHTIYEAGGIQPPVKLELAHGQYDSSRKVKDEYYGGGENNSLRSSWPTSNVGKFSGVDTSVGFYPTHVHAGGY